MTPITLLTLAGFLTYFAAGYAYIHMEYEHLGYRVGLVAFAATSVIWIPWVWKFIKWNAGMA